MTNRQWRIVLLAVVVGVAARAGYGLYRFGWDGSPTTLAYHDEQGYWVLAEGVASGIGLVGEFGHRAGRMPLYPALLAPCTGAPDGIAWARVAQWVIGGLAAGLTCLLAHRCGAPMWPAGLLVALDPGLVGASSLLLTETLSTTCLVALWLVAAPLRSASAGQTLRWAAVGLLSALCIHVREANLFSVGILLVFLLAQRRDRESVRGAIRVALIVIVLLAPWALRNQRVIDSWTWLTTRGGISLYDGVRPGATGASDLAGVKDAPEVRGLSEVAWDAHFRREAWRAIREDPVRMLRLAGVKLARTWSPVLNAGEYQTRAVRLIFASWSIPLCALVLVGCWRCRRSMRTAWYLLLPALSVCAVHAVFVGSVRYRVGAMPALAVLAAIGLGGWRRPPGPADAAVAAVDDPGTTDAANRPAFTPAQESA